MVFCSSPDHSHEHGLRWPLETTWTMDTNIVPPLVDHGVGSGAGWRSRAFVSSRLLHTTLLLCSPRCFYTCCCRTTGSLCLTIMLAAWRHHCVLLTTGIAARATEAATTCQRPSHWPKGTNHRPYSATTFPLSTLAAFIPIITTTTSLPLLLSTAWGGYTRPPFVQTPWDHFLKAALYHHRYSQPLPSWINVTVANFSNLCIF